MAKRNGVNIFRKFGVWVVLGVSIILNVFLLLRGVPETDVGGVKVIGVIDGDTLVFEGKSKIRLRYVDAPELEYCGGLEAKKILEDLVLNKYVRISDMIPDMYGRGLAVVFEGKKFVNAEMVKSGWVRYLPSTSQFSNEMNEAFEESKKIRSGIFGVCQSRVPVKRGCDIKGNIARHYNKKTYFVPGCREYEQTTVELDLGDMWFCSEKQAVEAGFTKAKNC